MPNYIECLNRTFGVIPMLSSVYRPSCRLDKHITDVLEENNIHVYYSGGEEAELEWFAPNGTDMVCNIQFDGTDDDFVDKVQDCADNLDPILYASEASDIESEAERTALQRGAQEFIDLLETVASQLSDIRDSSWLN